MPYKFIKTFLFVLMLCVTRYANTFAQAPDITYTTPNVYYVNNTITPLQPSNSGGPVFIYGQTTTLAGGSSGSANGTGTAASFNLPLVTALDAAGNVYVADSENQLIRKITQAGVVTTFAGTGSIGSANGTGTNASFNHPAGLAFDSGGNLYVADEDNNLIRKITPAGVVTTFAGSGIQGFSNGSAFTAKFNNPCGMVFDPAGNLYVTDYYNNMIRRITPAGDVSTFAGSGQSGSVDGLGANASFTNPISVTIDIAGNLFVADRLSQKIRKITPSGVVSTFAGSGNQGSADGQGTAASFNYPTSITIDNRGYLFVADKAGNNIRRITPGGLVSTTAGTTSPGFVDGIRQNARLSGPFGIIYDGIGYLYVADYSNNAIRKVVSPVYYIEPATLPTGLLFDEYTGIISGKPTIVWPTTIYTVTAYNKSGSSSTPVSITVIDPAIVQPSITVSAASGNINTCAGNVSSTYQQITVSGVNLTAPILATAPTGFQIATSSTGAFTNSITLNPVLGSVPNTILYVRLAATAVTGVNTGSVTFTSTGATSTITAIAGTVNALATVNTVNNQTLCNGSVSLVTIFSGTADSYSWTNSTPSIGLAASGTGDIPAFNAINNGNTTITATITVMPIAVSSGCNGTPITFTITVNPTQIQSLSISGSETEVCDGTPVNFKASISSNSASVFNYQWKVNGQNAGTNSSAFTTATLKNGDIVTCTANALTGCFATVTSNAYTAIIDPLPVISLNGGYTINLGDAIQLIPVITGYITQYAWSPSAGLSAANIAKPIAKPAITTTYTLTVTSGNNCTAVASIKVNVIGNVIVPNTFTPNADGRNDTWAIASLIYYPTCTVTVYNRYGTKIYHSVGYTTAWDGTMNGKVLPVGAYYYMINLNDGTKPLSGSVTIIR